MHAGFSPHKVHQREPRRCKQGKAKRSHTTQDTQGISAGRREHDVTIKNPPLESWQRGSPGFLSTSLLPRQKVGAMADLSASTLARVVAAAAVTLECLSTRKLSGCLAMTWAGQATAFRQR